MRTLVYRFVIDASRTKRDGDRSATDAWLKTSNPLRQQYGNGSCAENKKVSRR